MIINPIVVGGIGQEVEQATPAITVSSSGLITASATQDEGHVAAGTKTVTKQLPTKAAATITPGKTNQTIAGGQYLTGAQTIKGDANLLPANIRGGVSIFGVVGTATASSEAAAGTYRNSVSGSTFNVYDRSGAHAVSYGTSDSTGVLVGDIVAVWAIYTTRPSTGTSTGVGVPEITYSGATLIGDESLSSGPSTMQKTTRCAVFQVTDSVFSVGLNATTSSGGGAQQ